MLLSMSFDDDIIDVSSSVSIYFGREKSLEASRSR